MEAMTVAWSAITVSFSAIVASLAAITPHSPSMTLAQLFCGTSLPQMLPSAAVRCLIYCLLVIVGLFVLQIQRYEKIRAVRLPGVGADFNRTVR